MGPALLLDEGALDHVVARLPRARRSMEATAIEQGAGVLEHRRTAAQHHSVVSGIQRRQARHARHVAVGDGIGDAPAVAEGSRVTDG